MATVTRRLLRAGTGKQVRIPSTWAAAIDRVQYVRLILQTDGSILVRPLVEPSV